MRALVTGASGFIGSYLATLLKNSGWDVHLILRKTSRKSPHGFEGMQTHLYSGEPEDIRRIVASVKPDVTFHLASYFLAQHTYNDVPTLCDSNITFGTLLADALVQNECRNLVVAGTAWQNFAGVKGQAVCLYAATKEAFDAVLRYYSSATSLRVTALKIYDTYGPGDPRGKLLAAVRKAVRTETSMDLVKGGQKLHMLHVEDVARAFSIAAERLLKETSPGGQFEEFYLRTNEVMSLRELVELFCQVNNVHLKANWGARDYRPREVMQPWSEGLVLPGWQPQISLNEGLKSFFNAEE